MSIENGKENSKKERIHPAGAAIIGGMIGAAVVGANSGLEKAENNSHLLTPAAISELQSETDATDSEISSLQSRLKRLMHEELTRLRNGK